MGAQIIHIHAGQTALPPGEARAIAEVVARGGLIVFPTETVYGLGCAAQDEVAVGRLYALKRREREKPLALHLGSVDEVFAYARVGERERRLIRKLLPGPYTLLLEAKPEAPRVAVREGKVGVRVPASASFRLVAAAARAALAGTSANLSGQPPAVTPEEALEFRDRDEVKLIVVSDEPLSGRSSTVLDLTVTGEPRVLRGALTPELEALLRDPG